MKKIQIYRRSAKEFYQRFLLWIVSIIGFSSIAGCQEQEHPVPLYGVAPEYGVPPNYKYITIKGSILSEKDSLPVEKIKVTCTGSRGSFFSESDNTGAYIIDFS